MQGISDAGLGRLMPITMVGAPAQGGVSSLHSAVGSGVRVASSGFSAEAVGSSARQRILDRALARETLVPASLRAPKAVMAGARAAFAAEAGDRADGSAPAPVAAAPEEAAPLSEKDAVAVKFAADCSVHALKVLAKLLAGQDLPEDKLARISAQVTGLLQKHWTRAEDSAEGKVPVIATLLKNFIPGVPVEVLVPIAQFISSMIYEGSLGQPLQELEAAIGKILSEAAASQPAEGASEAGATEGAEEDGSDAPNDKLPLWDLAKIRADTKDVKEIEFGSVKNKLTISLSTHLSVEILRNPDDDDNGAQVNLYAYGASPDAVNAELGKVAVIHQDVAYGASFFNVVGKDAPVKLSMKIDFIDGVTQVDGRGRAVIEVFHEGTLYRVVVPTEERKIGFR